MAKLHHTCEHCGNLTSYEVINGARRGPRGAYKVLDDEERKRRKQEYNRRYYEKKKAQSEEGSQ